MRFLAFVVVMVLLCLSCAFAAEVTKEGSGIVRGSIAYTFDYDPADPGPTVIQGIRQSDVITVVTVRNRNGLVQKFELYFKSLINGKWGYEVIKGERGLSIGLGERQSFDVDKDGTLDITMELTAYDPVERGTITIYPYKEVKPVTEPNATAQNLTGVEEEVIVEVIDEELMLPEEPTLDESTAPDANDAPEHLVLLPIFVTGLIILLLALGGWYIYRHDLIYEKAEKKTKKDEEEYIPFDDLELTTEEKIITRSPRKRVR